MKNLPVRFCPQCEHMVALERIVSGGQEHWKCCNCWAIHMQLDELPLRPQRRDSDATSTTY